MSKATLGFLIGWFAALVCAAVIDRINHDSRGLSPKQVQQALDICHEILAEKSK